MYAVIRTGGKQYLVQEGETLKIEKLETEVGSTIDLEVLFVGDEKAIKVGAPIVSGAKVSAKVLEHGRARKVRVVKYKPKSRYRKVAGHRQPFTKIQVASIK
jgi:large subunit ribosomal protein L21